MLAESRVCRLAFLIFCLVVVAGCEPPKFYECEGIVTRDGKPIAGLQVTFNPVILDSVRAPLGLTDKDGRFLMASAHRKGVPPGTYIVCVEDPVAADGRQSSTDEDYLYVIDRYSPIKSDYKYLANAHRRDLEIKLDTKDYVPPEISTSGVEGPNP